MSWVRVPSSTPPNTLFCNEFIKQYAPQETEKQLKKPLLLSQNCPKPVGSPAAGSICKPPASAHHDAAIAARLSAGFRWRSRARMRPEAPKGSRRHPARGYPAKRWLQLPLKKYPFRKPLMGFWPAGMPCPALAFGHSMLIFCLKLRPVWYQPETDRSQFEIGGVSN